MSDTVRVTNSAAITIATATWTNLSFDTETWDTAGMHDAVNPDRLTCITAGYYIIIGQVEWAVVVGGLRYVNINHSVTTNIAMVSPGSTADGVTTPRQIVTTLFYMTPGEYVELMVLQESGGNLNINNAFFMMIQL